MVIVEYVCWLLAAVTRLTISRHISLSVDTLVHSCKDAHGKYNLTGPSFTSPCTTRCYLQPLCRLETWPMNFRIQDCSKTDRRCLISSIWSMEISVPNYIHQDPKHYSQGPHKQNIYLLFSISRSIHVSAAYRNIGELLTFTTYFTKQYTFVALEHFV